jgi:hypothetical protein
MDILVSASDSQEIRQINIRHLLRDSERSDDIGRRAEIMMIYVEYFIQETAEFHKNIYSGLVMSYQL